MCFLNLEAAYIVWRIRDLVEDLLRPETHGGERPNRIIKYLLGG
jgi:hypothetical protein